MKCKLEVPAHLVKESTIFYVNIDNQEEQFPLACIGRDSYICENSFVNTGLELTLHHGYSVHNVQIGNFNSIAEETQFNLGINHDYTVLSMGVSKLFGEEILVTDDSDYNQEGQIIIHNDVWIGRNATIMPGVTIHNGAVVASNSHVVKDVPPYAIVGGNPAKIIKYRFSQEIIDKLLTIKWWDWSNEDIQNNVSHFKSKDIEKFCDTFYEKYKNEKDSVKAYEINKAEHNYLYFLDFTEKHSIFERVIEQFIYKYKNSSDHQLVLFVDRNFADLQGEFLQTFYQYLEYHLDRANAVCLIYICIDDKGKSRSLFKAVDYYITNRAKETVLYAGYANEFDVTIISGVNRIIF